MFDERTRDIRRLGRAHEAALTGTRCADGPRPTISESWRRSLGHNIHRGSGHAPLVFGEDELGDVRAQHPLARYLPVLRKTMHDFMDASEHMMVVSDADGNALWLEGPTPVWRKADRIGLAAGSQWGEQAMGTNGIGTPLAAGRPVSVFSAEHFLPALHTWSCAGAPITDPDTGLVVGCLDVSATLRALHPASVSLVAAAAHITEAQMAADMNARDDRFRSAFIKYLGRASGGAIALATSTGRILSAHPHRWAGTRVSIHPPHAILPDGRPALAEELGEGYLLRAIEQDDHTLMLSLSLLGDHPSAQLGDQRFPLSLRHAEILALLTVNPGGLTSEQLTFHLYGDAGSTTTTRAEIHRLRSRLGGVVLAKPYRLSCDVRADFLMAAERIAVGDIAGAARIYHAPLLPRSESPTIRAHQDRLAVQMRNGLLNSDDPGAIWTYLQGSEGQYDVELMERLTALLPDDDPRRHSAQAMADHALAVDWSMT